MRKRHLFVKILIFEALAESEKPVFRQFSRQTKVRCFLPCKPVCYTLTFNLATTGCADDMSRQQRICQALLYRQRLAMQPRSEQFTAQSRKAQAA